MTPPEGDPPHQNARDGNQQGHTERGHTERDGDELSRAVDAAAGSGSDRAFALLDDLAANTGSTCLCQRCRTRTMMLNLVLRRELQLLDLHHARDGH